VIKDLDNNIIWKDIIINGILTYYEVSNTGLVRNKKRGNILIPDNINKGYLRVILYVDKKMMHKFIHVLVALAFIPNDDPEHKTQINHINGIKYDNRVENLEWCDQSHNIKEAFRLGLIKSKYGEDHHNSIYTNDEINLVCQLLEQKIPMKLITKLTNISYSKIKSVKSGNTWKYISLSYNINYKENYNYKNIKYKDLKKILIKLNIFNTIDLSDLLYSKYIIKKKKLIKDLENLGYEIFIDKKLIKEFKKDYEDNDDK